MFRHKHRTPLQLARFDETVTRKFGEKWVTDAISPEVAKAFHTVRVDGFLYSLTVVNVPSYMIKTIFFLALPKRPAFLVRFLESSPSIPERWLREWRLSINVSNSTEMSFEKSCRCNPKLEE